MTHTKDISQSNLGWLFHQTPWESGFLSRFPLINHELRIACPFIKIRNIKLILASLPQCPSTPIRLRLLTRLNVPDCRARVHDVAAIELLRSNPLSDRCNIDVRINNSLHAKCFIFDSNEVIVTSSNLTFAAFHKNLEIALAMSQPQIIATSIRYFDEIFESARPVSDSAIESVKTRIPLFALQSVGSPVEPAPDTAPEELTEDLPNELLPQIDPQAVDKLEEALSSQLQKDLHKSCFYLASPDGPSTADHGEDAYFEELAARFVAVFGGPIPSHSDVAVMFVHASADKLIKGVTLDVRRAEQLEIMGRHWLEVAIIEALIQASPGPLEVGLLTQKKGFILASEHCIRVFHDLGLARVIVGASLSDTSDATKRAEFLLLRKTVFRVLGYLGATRRWRDVATRVIELLDISEAFPFKSYDDYNYKSQLQKAAQSRGLGVPTYSVFAREGPDHDPIFVVNVSLNGRMVGEGRGSPIKVAETRAAYEALRKVQAEIPSTNRRAYQAVSPELMNRARTHGVPVLRQVTSRELPERLALDILIPSGAPRAPHADRREELATLGGVVRSLVAYQTFFSMGASAAEATSRVSFFNKNERLIRSLQQTPFCQWLEEVSKEHQFRTAGDPRVVVETINACFGALFRSLGIESCAGLASLLLRPMETEAAEDVLQAKSRLQIALQAKFKENVSKALEFRLKALHAKNESHNPLFEVRVCYDGLELGRATGKSRKAAENSAAALALTNPAYLKLVE